METLGHNPEANLGELGEHYLDLIGLKGLADKTVEHNGQQIQGRDFLKFGSGKALEIFKEFEKIDPNDPSYETEREFLRSWALSYFPDTEE